MDRATPATTLLKLKPPRDLRLIASSLLLTLLIPYQDKPRTKGGIGAVQQADEEAACTRMAPAVAEAHASVEGVAVAAADAGARVGADADQPGGTPASHAAAGADAAQRPGLLRGHAITSGAVGASGGADGSSGAVATNAPAAATGNPAAGDAATTPPAADSNVGGFSYHLHVESLAAYEATQQITAQMANRSVAAALDVNVCPSNAAAGLSEASGPVERVVEHCANHGCDKVGVKHCSRCGTSYCSAACQKKHWSNGHKKQCRARAADRQLRCAPASHPAPLLCAAGYGNLAFISTVLPSCVLSRAVHSPC